MAVGGGSGGRGGTFFLLAPIVVVVAAALALLFANGLFLMDGWWMLMMCLLKNEQQNAKGRMDALVWDVCVEWWEDAFALMSGCPDDSPIETKDISSKTSHALPTIRFR